MTDEMKSQGLLAGGWGNTVPAVRHSEGGPGGGGVRQARLDWPDSRQQQTQMPPLSILISMELSSTVALSALLIHNGWLCCLARLPLYTLSLFASPRKQRRPTAGKGTRVKSAGGWKRKIWERDAQWGLTEVQLLLFQKRTPTVVSVMLSSWYRAPCTLHLSTVRKSPLCRVNTHTYTYFTWRSRLWWL